MTFQKGNQNESDNENVLKIERGGEVVDRQAEDIRKLWPKKVV